MEINNNSFTQKPSESNKITKTSSKSKADIKAETQKAISTNDDILISQKNDLSIVQSRITGLESLKNALDKAPEEGQNKIDEILEKSQVHNQKVLEPYAPELKNTTPAELPVKVETLINRLKTQRQEIMNNIEKTEISEQNKLSLASWNNQEDPEKLLKQVVSSMENQKNLFNDIPIERIKDLLSD